MSPHCLCYPLVNSFRSCQPWAKSNIYGWCRFLAICVFSVGLFVLPAQADDWSVDFEGELPEGWVDFGVHVPTADLSPTFTASLENGYLRLSDSQAAVAGGSFGGFGGVATSVFTNVRVSAQVNVAQDGSGDLGVVARTDLDTGDAYFGNVDFEGGDACIAKVKITEVDPGTDVGADLACSAVGLLDTSASYFVQLEAVGNSPTNLKLNVFDQQGGNLLATVSTIDDGTTPGFGADYASGVAGVFAIPPGGTLPDALTQQINGTFDNASAITIPEPASSVLLLLGIAALLRWQPKSK